MYIYVKNNMIVASGKDGNLTIGKRYEVEKEGFYKVKDGVPYLVEDEMGIEGAFLVRDRKRDEYERRRKEAIGESEETKEESTEE